MTETDPMPAGRAARLHAALNAHFQPISLQVTDDSARHAGHSGARDGGETHFNVVMVAAAFAGVSRVQRSRLVHDLLTAEFTAGLHALSLNLRAPDEARTSPA